MSRMFNKVISILLAAALLIPSVWHAPVAEAATPEIPDPVVLSQSFEDDSFGGWVDLGWNGTGTTVISSVYASEGTKSLKYTNRSDRKSALSLNLTNLLKSDHIYDISFKLRSDEGTDIYHLGTKLVADGAESYPWIIQNQNVTDSAWTTFELKEYKLPSNTTEFIAWIEADITGAPSTAKADFYLDEVLIKDVTPFVTHNFDDGTTQGWTASGAGTATNSVVTANSGANSLLSAGRTENWNGPQIDVTPHLVKGGEYRITSYVKLASGSAASNLKMTMKQEPDKYDTINTAVQVTDSDWVMLQGTYTFSNSPTKLFIYIESDDPTASYYVDDFTIVLTKAPSTGGSQPVLPKLTYNFDDGTKQGWDTRGGGTSVVINDSNVKSAPHALQNSGRTGTWNGPSIDLKSTLQTGASYSITGYAMLKEKTGTGSTVKLSMVRKSTADENEGYDTIATANNVANSDWVKLEGSYKVTDTMTILTMYVESSNQDDVIIVDDFVIQMTEAPPLDQSGVSYDFESGVQGWAPRNGDEVVESTSEANHTPAGSKSIKTTVVPTGQYDGALVSVLGKMHENHEYELSAWVKMAEGQDSTRLRISVQFDTSYPNVSQTATVTSSDWVELKGTYIMSGTATTLNAYIEVADDSDNTRIFYIDDFKLTYVGAVGGLPVQTDIPRIKDVYKDYFLIGGAVSSTEFSGKRLELLKQHHNVVTAENAMKPDQTQAVKGTFTWADTLVDTSIAEGMDVHGHVLVWHQQTADWMHTANGSPLTREAALTNMKDHIKEVIEHYGDRVISWDVVNEAMNDNPSNPADWKASLRTSGWKSAIGDDYVEQAYLATREVIDANGWDIKLYYNDYNDDNQNKATAIYNMIKEINDRYALTHPGKLLIEGMGMQGHYNINTKPENVKRSLEKFISLGVEVSITELDVTAGDNSEITEKQAIAQGYLYAQLMNIYKAHSVDIARVTFWGLIDSTSWRKEQSPLLFDKDFQAKPAYYAVIDPDAFIAANPPASASANQATAKYATPVVDGNVDSVWSTASDIPINRYQMAWQGASGVAKALWDNQYLYVLVQVSDAQLDKGSTNAYEQDSIEVFLDQNNAKSFSYEDDDGQYRVNFDNETSFNPEKIAAGFESATKVSGTNYTVELKIPLNSVTPANNTKLGFDVQINDAKDGARQSVAAWNDLSGQGFQDTSVYGELTLSGTTGTIPSSSGGIVTIPSTEKVENKDGAVTITPEVKKAGDRVTGIVSEANLKKALEQATPAASGKKQIVIDIPAQAGSTSYDVQLPIQNLKSSESYVLIVKTGNGTIEIPNNMLSNTNTDDATSVTIRISQASTEGLDASVREQIGNRPIININALLGDKVIAWNNPSAPVTISLPYKPTAEELSRPDHIVVWYIDGEGKVVSVPNGRYNAATGEVRFHTTHFSTYAITSVFKSFEDLNTVPWAKQAIEVMASHGVISGISAANYNPTATIKRADFIALLVRALELQGSSNSVTMFSDVKESDYFYKEVLIAKELGIASGTGNNTFLPNSNITRQDMMVLTARALEAANKALEAKGSLNSFTDTAAVSDYALDSVTTLVSNGIVSGMNGKLAPNETLTRAQAAVILYQIWNN